MKEIKILQREAQRSSKLGLAKSKKPNKIYAKNLDDAFDSVAEDPTPITSKDFSSFSSISQLGRNGEPNTESFTLLDSELSASSGILPNSDLVPSSEITSVETFDSGLVSRSDCRFGLEAQIAIGVLEKASSQVLSSDAVDSQSKKLLHALVQMAIEILVAAPEEKDRFNEILVAKTRIVGGFFLLCVLATVALRLFVGSGPRSSYGKPPPT